MQSIARQLARIRRTGRGLLILQRLAQAATVAVAGVAVLTVIDFGLRLPAPVRVGLIGVLAVAVVGWLTGRLVAAVRFAPSLTDLALRAERLFPELRGSLASAVEFTEHAADYADPQRTATLAAASRERVRAAFDTGQLRRLLAPAATLFSLGAAVLGLGLLAVTVNVAPEFSRIAAARWFTPWADVQWPKRTDVVTLTRASAWPADTPLPLRAAVGRGYHPRMRVWVNYRLIDHRGAPGPWRSALMSEQTHNNGERRARADSPLANRFERLVELAERAPAANKRGERGHVEYYFEAGDDRTRPATVALVDRPAVTAVRATLTPPPYARSLLEPETTDLHTRSNRVPTVRGLVGSTAELDVAFNKPVRIEADDLARFVPGLVDEQVALTLPEEGARAARRVKLTFPLRESMRTSIELTDEHGFANLSEYRYALEAITDEPPAVSILEPDADRSVLPEARVDVEALVQDDVGAESVALEAQVPGASDSESRETASPRELARQSGQVPRLTVAHTLDLAEFALQPGDAVTLTAVGRDIYELDGQRHGPVRSAPRRLRIIDAGTLAGQLRGELAGVRQQALRLDSEQRRIGEQPADDAAPRQGRLTDRLGVQRRLVEGLIERAERNRLDAPTLTDMMDQARDLLERAGEASEEARDRLAEDTDADEQQEAVRAALSELVSLLDQGQDALARRLELQRLRTTQRNLEAQTRELLPQTVGEALENLPEALREQLEDLARQQRQASEDAQELVRQMRQTSAALSQQDQSDESRAAAEALREAADLAQEEGLSERMGESSQSIDRNQLSRANQDQAESLDVMERMLSEMGEQDQRMQAMLQRRLQELSERLRRLIERQNAQLAALEDAANVIGMAEAQSTLRRATMAAAESARESERTIPVSTVIDQAVTRQGEAVRALRENEAPDAAHAEQVAVERLEEALELIQEQRERLAQEQADEEREQLKAEYEALADRQDELREAVGQVMDQAGEDGLARRERAALVQHGHEQADIGVAASKLRERVEDALLFQHLHDRVDDASRQAARRLRRALVDEQTRDDQQRIAADLRRMAAVLEQATQRAQFAGQQGGGGGGEGGGGDPPLVPPMAELRLLRELQSSVLEQTRGLADAAVREDDAARSRLIDLSAEQRALSDLGERLIEQMNQQRMVPQEMEEGQEGEAQ
ncbi:MAG: hypothetical protein ACODAQ_04265 [Phycisphaeraceae bacterium]